MPTKPKEIIALAASVEIAAAEAEGEKKSPRKFTATFYTGGALDVAGWEDPIAIDLAGLENAKTLVANLDHDTSKRVGNFAVANDGKTLVANGTASARTAARDEVIGSAEDGYEWQASLEVRPKEVEHVKAGKVVEVNGQLLEGPLYVTRKGTLKGFAFVSHGADDNTTATIAASAATRKGKTMDAEFKTWVEQIGFDTEELTAEQLAGMKANYDGVTKPKSKAVVTMGEALDAKAAELQRIEAITEVSLQTIDKRPFEKDQIKALANQAAEEKWTIEKFRLQLYDSSFALAAPFTQNNRLDGNRITGEVIEAAICQAGRYENVEKDYDAKTNQIAHDKFKGRLSLKQMLLMAAEANGYRNGHSQDVNIDVQRAAFGMRGPREIQAQGFSTIDVSSIIANTANKFLYEGWMHVDQTALAIASIRNVRDFKTITTVSLTGDAQYTQVGAAGEIKHATLGELTYTNKADTYAAMLAITRQDIINDDLNALTAVPRRLGRGAMLALNHIFWTEFLAGEAAGFWAAGNSNINTGAADMTIAGLTATEVIFMNQTDPDGKPLGVAPEILLVPTQLKAAANALTDPQSQLITGANTTIPDTNVFRGRFKVYSSPYMGNSSYTGYSIQEWYMMANPNVLSTIEIAALNGRVEPVVDTADADFNTLGIQMRGYSDVGVNLQEKRASVLADGNAS